MALLFSVIGTLLAVGLLALVQFRLEIKRLAKLRRLKYVTTSQQVTLEPLTDVQAFHLFLSHAWPAAPDRMRIVKARLAEALLGLPTLATPPDCAIKPGAHGATERPPSPTQTMRLSLGPRRSRPDGCNPGLPRPLPPSPSACNGPTSTHHHRYHPLHPYPPTSSPPTLRRPPNRPPAFPTAYRLPLVPY